MAQLATCEWAWYKSEPMCNLTLIIECGFLPFAWGRWAGWGATQPTFPQNRPWTGLKKVRFFKQGLVRILREKCFMLEPKITQFHEDMRMLWPFEVLTPSWGRLVWSGISSWETSVSHAACSLLVVWPPRDIQVCKSVDGDTWKCTPSPGEGRD
jgi:hypothetical protein